VSDRLKLTILGGGGFRTPLVHSAVLRGAARRPVTEIALYDTDPVRLRAIDAVLAQAAHADPGAPTVSVHTDLGAALDGADFVFSAMRVGGLRGRTVDERVALDAGLLGQETTGAGGVVYGIRTVPVALRVARLVAERCPGAWVINFTNPAGMVTQAMQSILGDRVIGICDSPVSLARHAVEALGLDPAGATLDYAGLNHLGWLRGITIGGRDVLPDLLADEAALLATEEGALFGAEWIRSLGALPNEYLYYYYFTREAIAGIRRAGPTRGEYLLRQQTAFYERVAAAPDHALRSWNEANRERSSTYLAELREEGEQRSTDDVLSGGYEAVALALMDALVGGPAATLVLNIRGRGHLPGLAEDDVVEVPCRVDSSGPVPQAVSALTGHMLGLVQQVKAVEHTAIAAATEGSTRLAVHALATHPLVDSVAVARELVARYRSGIPEFDAVFVP
jgi:6-phospho-beta-glucosidase